jgi:hypothetical protein
LFIITADVRNSTIGTGERLSTKLKKFILRKITIKASVSGKATVK